MTTEKIDGSGFDGEWVMDLSRSKVWDFETQRWVPETLANQRLLIRTEGDVMYYKISVGIENELTTHMAYTCRFSDTEWAPYVVESIEGDPEAEALKPGDLLKNGMRLGEPLAFIKQVYVDPRTQYRITKNPDGSAQYVMLRRLSEDGAVNTGTVLDAEGNAIISKAFVRP